MIKLLVSHIFLTKTLLLIAFLFYSQILIANTHRTIDDLLELSLEALGDITIATRTSRSLSEIPSTVFVYDQDDIRKHGWTSLAELIQDIPGVDVINKGGRGASLSARGVADLNFHGNKTVVMIDGHNAGYSAKSSPGFSGFMNQYDIFNAKRVEVLLGPGGTLHGANAFGIVINIITMAPEDIAGIETDFVYGSQGEYIPSVRFGTRSGKLGIFHSFTLWNQTDSDLAEIAISKNQDDSLVIYNNNAFEAQASENIDLHGYVDYNHEFRLGYRYSQIIGGRGTALVSTKKGQLIVTQPMLYLDYNAGLTDRFTYKLSSHYKKSKTDLSNNYFIDTTLNRVGVSGDESNSLVIDNQFTFFQNNQLTWVGGLFFERSRQRPAAVKITPGTTNPEDRQQPTPNDEENYNNYAGYLQLEWIPGNAFYLVGGLRYVVTETKYASELVPRLGVRYAFSDTWLTKFNYQRGYRPPAVGEGLQRGLVAANPDISSETIDNYELSLIGNPNPQLGLRATLFYSDIQNLIGRTAYTGSGNFAGIDDNIGKIQVRGAEFGANLELDEKFEIQSTATYTDSEDKLTGQKARTIIPYKLNLSLIAQLKNHWELVWDNYIRLRPRTDTQNALFEGKNADDWILSNLTVNYSRAFNIQDLKLMFSIRNLLNQEYGHIDPRATISSNANPPFLTSYHPQEKRIFLLGVNYHFK